MQNSEYLGARFFKCDLQVQTPADANHWRGPKMGNDDAAKREAAEAFVRRCHETQLEVIAFTDHNFLSKGFIPYIQKAAKQLRSEFGYEIIVFPGFEFEADVGKGIHVLAIFEPDFDLDTVDHTLTECGVGHPRFTAGVPLRSTKRLPEILEIVQRKDSSGGVHGIVILPHPMSQKGLFDSDKIAEWLQAEEWKNPDLYCVEIPKPVAEMSAGWQRLFGNGADCDPTWRRNRPIGCVMSSDAKALKAEDCAENYIGSRHSWIKMSRPSIESLRQAFLDHESRIRFDPVRPEASFTYPKLRTLTVRGAAFLDDQEIVFSPNLTTIIGGRGTGKSTLVEYIRIALAQGRSVRGKDPLENFRKLRESIREKTEIVAEIEKEGQAFAVLSRGGADSMVQGETEAPDLSRFFPSRVLSQKEIYAIAEDPDARRSIIDDLIRRDLDELARREGDVVQGIRALSEKIAGAPELRGRETILVTECRGLELRLARLKEVETPLVRWKGLLEESAFFQRLMAESRTVAAALRTTLDEIGLPSISLNADLSVAPNAALVSRVAGESGKLLANLKAAVEGARQEFLRGMAELLLSDSEVVVWRSQFNEEKTEYEKLRDELVKQGADPDGYLRYQRELRERQSELTRTRERISEINGLILQRDGGLDSEGNPKTGLMKELWSVWAKQAELRKGAASSLTEGVPKTEDGKAFVRVTVESFGDENSFLEKMRDEIQDQRRITLDDWDTFMRAVFASATAGGLPPMEVLNTWTRTLGQGQIPAGSPWTPVSDRRYRVIQEWLTEKRLTELSVWRTPDRVKIELFRQDGSFVGELEGPLSVGQRCTAVLALLLARDDVPVVIDQPEEDLDNEFIFSELVPLLRKVKEQRQVIVVSHNANIPVNADAELVVALETRNQRGCQKRVGAELAVGALDRASVKEAVENIMEGSERAFRQRFEKYGF